MDLSGLSPGCPQAETRPEAVLFGLGRLNLGLTGEVLHDAGVRLVGVTPRSADIIAALRAAGRYRIVVPGIGPGVGPGVGPGGGPRAGGMARMVPLEESYYHDPRVAAIDAPAVRRAAEAQILVSGMAKSDPLLYELTARYFLDVLAYRARHRITAPVDLCCNENPIGSQNASDLLRTHILQWSSHDSVLQDHLRKFVRFPRLLPDRICSERRVAPRDGIVEVVAESHRELIVAGPTWHLHNALSNTRGCVLAGDDLAEVQRRKLYLFCMAHALLGYFGAYRGCVTTSEAWAEPPVRRLVCSALSAVATALAARNPPARAAARAYASQVIRRIRSGPPGDLILRVVRDPLRKLSREDRLVGPALIVLRHCGTEPHALVLGIATAFHFCRRYVESFRRGSLAANAGEEVDDRALQIGEALQFHAANPAPCIGSICGLSRHNAAESRLLRSILATYHALMRDALPERISDDPPRLSRSRGMVAGSGAGRLCPPAGWH